MAKTLRFDSARTREQLIAAARELCHEVGYEQLKMSDIADRVGCSRATVYNHFQDRDVLLEALCQRYLEGYLDIHDRVRDWAGSESTVFEVVRRTVFEELRWRADNSDLRDALDTARTQRQEFYVQGEAQIDEAMLAWFGAIFGASQQQGLLRDAIDTTVATRAVYAMIDHTVTGLAADTPADQIAEISHQVALLAWHALYPVEPGDAPLFQKLNVGTVH